jgi:hypothetical protein
MAVVNDFLALARYRTTADGFNRPPRRLEDNEMATHGVHHEHPLLKRTRGMGETGSRSLVHAVKFESADGRSPASSSHFPAHEDRSQQHAIADEYDRLWDECDRQEQKMWDQEMQRH